TLEADGMDDAPADAAATPGLACLPPFEHQVPHQVPGHGNSRGGDRGHSRRTCRMPQPGQGCAGEDDGNALVDGNVDDATLDTLHDGLVDSIPPVGGAGREIRVNPSAF